MVLIWVVHDESLLVFTRICIFSACSCKMCMWNFRSTCLLSISTYLFPYLTIKEPRNRHSSLPKKCLEFWQHRALVLVVSRYVLRWRPSRTILFEIVYWRFKALMNATLTFVMSCPIVKMHSWALEKNRQKKWEKNLVHSN